MLDSPWFAIPIILNFIMLLFGPMLYMEEIGGNINFKLAIVLQIWLKNNFKDELTDIGIIILQVLASIIFLPYTLVMSVFIAIKYILVYIWHWYKYIFRKKE